MIAVMADPVRPMGRAGAAPTALTTLLVATLLGGCGRSDEPDHGEGVASFPVGGVADYQIGGAYEPAADVDVVIRDRRAAPVDGRYSICYVNAFQTQPEDEGFWTSDHPAVLLTDASGDWLTDPDWPGEIILDTSTEAARAEIMAVVGPWIDGCADDGFQAVEPDNLDSWTRTGVAGRVTQDDNVAMASLLAERAHAHGLAIGQKNTPQLGPTGPDEVGFDFAIAEECAFYDECAAYIDVYAGAVIDIEYADNGRAAFDGACADHAGEISVIYRDRDVSPAGGPAYEYDHC